MGDPQTLYVIAAIVLTGLVGWVITVLVRCDKLPLTPETERSEPRRGLDGPALGAGEPALDDKRDPEAARKTPTATGPTG